MGETKGRDTPAAPGTSLERAEPAQHETQQMKSKPMRELCGSILYLSITSRPDIAYATNAVCRHVANPTMEHWTAAKRVLAYAIGTKDNALVYDGYSNPR